MTRYNQQLGHIPPPSLQESTCSDFFHNNRTGNTKRILALKNKQRPHANKRRVTRLQGELYTVLEAEAKRLGLRTATLAAHILHTQAEEWAGTGKFYLHPLTQAYLPTHNPKITSAEKARTITITLPTHILHTLEQMAEGLAMEKGFQNFETEVGRRNFLLAKAEQLREIQVSMLVNYLDKYGVL